MPPRKGTRQKHILSSTSSDSSQASKPLEDASNIFDVPAEPSPMHSPRKLKETLFNESPLKIPKLAPPKDARLLPEHRTYNFIGDRAERSLFLFEMMELAHAQGPGPGKGFNCDRLIASLYQVTAVENRVQLNWIRSHASQIASLPHQESFLQWLKEDVPILETPVFNTWMTSIAAVIIALIRAIYIFISHLIISVLMLVAFTWISYHFGLFSGETMNYIRIIYFVGSLVFN